MQAWTRACSIGFDSIHTLPTHTPIESVPRESVQEAEKKWATLSKGGSKPSAADVSNSSPCWLTHYRGHPPLIDSQTAQNRTSIRGNLGDFCLSGAPESAIDAAVLHRLGDMGQLNLGGFQIGDCAGDLQNAVKGACAQPQPLHRRA